MLSQQREEFAVHRLFANPAHLAHGPLQAPIRFAIDLSLVLNESILNGTATERTRETCWVEIFTCCKHPFLCDLPSTLSAYFRWLELVIAFPTNYALVIGEESLDLFVTSRATEAILVEILAIAVEAFPTYWLIAHAANLSCSGRSVCLWRRCSLQQSYSGLTS